MSDQTGAGPEVLDVREAAEYLRLNEQTVRRLARDREIPAFKVGGSWRFKRSSLDRWAVSQEQAEPTYKILAVDDDDTIRGLLKRILSGAGYAVEVASGGREALEIASIQTPDLILLDLHMPGMTGPQILEEIRKLYGNVPVVILTGYPESSLMEKALRFSPVTLLAKPSTPEKILESVRSLLP